MPPVSDWRLFTYLIQSFQDPHENVLRNFSEGLGQTAWRLYDTAELVALRGIDVAGKALLAAAILASTLVASEAYKPGTVEHIINETIPNSAKAIYRQMHPERTYDRPAEQIPAVKR